MDMVMIVAIGIVTIAVVVGVLLAYNDKQVGEWFNRSKNKNRNLQE